jgi:hypothetical protein
MPPEPNVTKPSVDMGSAGRPLQPIEKIEPLKK